MQRTLNPRAIYAMYGLTEAFRSTYLDPKLLELAPTAIGHSVPHAEVMVVRPDGTRAMRGERGELVHAGPLVTLGYWNDRERTAERFRPAPPWSHYGGIAVWSGDTVFEGEDGLLYYVGRDDEMIKTSGNRVSPTEIEEVALASGFVVEAVAFGISDERLGARIILFARPSTDNENPEGALRQYLQRELPPFMQPSQIVLRTRLPLGPNGKIDRNQLKKDHGA
jgi:acyl-CoA synthetase (AMP-forming)/AMP-acid ligase II